MARLATVEDFENGPMYSNYHRYPFFAQRADLIRQRYPNAVRILVAGCGYGFLVDELIQRGVNAWGVDASVYATGKAAVVLSTNARPRVLRGNCAVRTDMDAVKSAAGLRTNQRFDLVVQEDLLPCCDTDAEVQAVVTELRRLGPVLHLVWTHQDGDTHTLPLLWYTAAEWRARLGTDALWRAQTGEVL